MEKVSNKCSIIGPYDHLLDMKGYHSNGITFQKLKRKLAGPYIAFLILNNHQLIETQFSVKFKNFERGYF